jgi:PKD repeat protein
MRKMPYSFLRLPFLLLTFFLINYTVLAQCPVASNCTPGTAPTASFPFGMGIYNVTVGSGPSGFTNPTTTGSSAGYENFSCTKKATVAEGVATTISVTTNPNENVRVWVDLNNDGILQATSELVFSSNNAKVHSGTFTIPVHTSVVKNTILRMRVSADNFSSPIPTPCSTPAYSQVEDYGLTVLPNTNKPAVDFSVDKPVTCSPAVQFTNLVQNGATSYLWNFGDGTTSTSANLSHTYSATDTFNVKLKACNANGCDSLTKINYVTYHTNVPVAASCTPATTGYCCGYGITKVTFHTMVNTSQNEVAGYEDFTCTKSVTVEENVIYPIVLETGLSNSQDTWIYIDYNNNGTFEPGELVITRLNSYNPTGNILIQTGTVKNTPLRMRIISDVQGSQAGSCVNRTSGQIEDYTIITTPNIRKPVAAFNSNFNNICDSFVKFSDASQNGPTSYLWDFGDGSAKATIQNPLHKYSKPGSYTVKLKVCSAFGCDSISKQNYVTYTKNCPVYCIPPGNTNTNFGITNVTLNTINNSTGSEPNAYGNYTHLATTLIKGNLYTIKSSSNVTWSRITSVYIDLNQDGDFYDPKERVATGNSSALFSKNFILPATAKSGVTRLLIMASGTPFAPCTYGHYNLEIEDYSVFIIPNNQPPTALFTTLSPSYCSYDIAFADTSANSATSWIWDFGDPASGTMNSSTLQNPRHIFSGPGTYTIKLIACNNFGCDTLTKTTFVTITGNNGPKGVTCKPKILAQINASGIYNVTFSTINNSTAGNDGYRDYACTIGTTLIAGQSYPISIQNGIYSQEDVRVWIDYNNDGMFDPITELAFTSDFKKIHTGTITILNTAVQNHPLRMRIASEDNPDFSPPKPCENIQSGQVEDYAVTILPANTKPAPDFSYTNSCGLLLSFTDKTTFFPTTFSWNFGDPNSGNNNLATTQNAQHTFSFPGNYVVTLTTCNANGCNTLTKSVIVDTNSQIMAPLCQPPTTSTCCQYGIYNVSFIGINNSSGDATEGYKDFGCIKTTQAVPGTYPLTIQTGPTNGENVLAWIDFNNDGLFTAAEQVMNSISYKIHTAQVNVPSSAVKDKWLRMRIMAENNYSPSPQPCNALTTGQAEDYGIMIKTTLSIWSEKLATDFKLYPNPNNGTFSIEIPTVLKSDYQLEAQDLAGKTVATQTIKVTDGQIQPVDLGRLAKGVYLVRIFNTDISVVKKVIIE